MFILSLFELSMVILVFWGVFNEEKIAQFEQKIFKKWSKRK